MPEPIFYHSESSLPFYHSSTKTVFRLIRSANNQIIFEFGIISAKDNDTLSYVLFAPAKATRTITNLIDVNLNQSIPLLSKQVKEFIQILQSSTEKWNNKYSDVNGISYEFLVTPENRIFQETPNVQSWYSTLRYYFQNNEDGPMVTLVFGEGFLQYSYSLTKLSEIENLIISLNEAIKNY
jgi:hypothetical protein